MPALMIDDTSFIRSPNYDTMRDDIDTLSFDQIREGVCHLCVNRDQAE